MTGIGGFIGLEPLGDVASPYHAVPAFSTGRSCFRLILEAVRPRRVLVPFYACDALLRPLRRLGIEFRYYGIDPSLEAEPSLDGTCDAELVVAVNYFGLQGVYVRSLGASLGPRLVVDDCQAFFRRGTRQQWSFCSMRKFFGVPDGAYLYGLEDRPVRFTGTASPAVHHLQPGGGDPGQRYRQFQANEARMTDDLHRMSMTTSRMAPAIDYARAAARRRQNYRTLAARLEEHNLVHLSLSADDVPLYYPFLPPRSLRELLIERAIYVPCLWPDVAGRRVHGDRFAWECRLAKDLCPLPIDQRYDSDDMERVAAEVHKALEHRQGDRR